MKKERKKKPNKARIRKWVDALRTQKYKQTSGALREVQSGKAHYCCLGVACEVFRLAMKEEGKGYIWLEDGTKFLGDSGVLPQEVQDWFGLQKDPKTVLGSATQLNDELYLSFSEIADAVEETYLLPPKEKKKRARVRAREKKEEHERMMKEIGLHPTL